MTVTAVPAKDICKGYYASDPLLTGTVVRIIRMCGMVRLETDSVCNNVMYFHMTEEVQIRR